MSIVDRTAACACGWTSRQLRAGRVGEVSTGQQRAVDAAAEHLRRHGQR